MLVSMKSQKKKLAKTLKENDMSDLLKDIESYYDEVYKSMNQKTQEYYFGQDNPFKLGLISCFTKMREIDADAKNNGSTTPRNIIPLLEGCVEDLRQLAINTFNIEGISIGWVNDINAAMYVSVANSDLYGKDQDSLDRRVRLDDIVTTNNGFRYKNSKGIFYCLLIGYPIFADSKSIFTVEEAAAIACHEFGHAMQHVIDGINSSVAMGVYHSTWNLLKSDKMGLPGSTNLTKEDKMYLKEILMRFRDAAIRNDTKEIENIGKEFLDTSDKKTGISFSSQTDNDITQRAVKEFGDDYDTDVNEKMNNLSQKKGIGFFKGLGKFFKGIFTWGKTARTYKSIVRNDEVSGFRRYEEIADNFCSIYGLGIEMASVNNKFSRLKTVTRGGHSIIERIPILDLIYSIDQLKSDYYAAMEGYPTNKQRMINSYKACIFELKNNKDLPQKHREELEKQIEEYKKFYEEFVEDDSKKGIFYKLVAKIKRLTLEDAAKKDKWIDIHVLKPLQKRMDPNYDIDSVDE